MSKVYLSFNISNELFAINVQKVLEVLQKQEITPVPNAPEFIKGIINFRGEVVPVFDTRQKFNMQPLVNEDIFVVAVLDLIKFNEPFRIGAMVDKVHDVLTVNNSEIMPVPPMASKFDARYLSGIIKRNDQFIMLINTEELFVQKGLIQIEEE